MEEQTPTFPRPKYGVGDFVITIGLKREDAEVQCPDCLGKGTWEVTSPAGETFNVDCPRCYGRGVLRGAGWINKPILNEWQVQSMSYTARSFFIGHEREDTMDWRFYSERSGHGYHGFSDELFPATPEGRERATKAAQAKADEQNAKEQKRETEDHQSSVKGGHFMRGDRLTNALIEEAQKALADERTDLIERLEHHLERFKSMDRGNWEIDRLLNAIRWGDWEELDAERENS